jgi:mannose-6-phosphate isomerase-like protein (cupin superfamily)
MGEFTFTSSQGGTEMGISAINIRDVPIERMQERDGWAISEFRLPITGATGSKTTVFHSIFRAGSTHAKHLHENSDEIAVYLSGHGVVGQGASRAEVSSGHCRLMPKNSEHFFYNETKDEEAYVIGFYLNAPSVVGTGYKFCGDVNADDISQSRDGLNDGILVRLQEADAIDIPVSNGWKNAEVRPLIGTQNGSANALLHLTLGPGDSINPPQFTNAEAIYYVDAGTGRLIDETKEHEIEPGSFIFIPANSEHELQNIGEETLEIFMVLTGAGSIESAI